MRAKAALSYLFRPLQDLDIYVEDSVDEVFYSLLMNRIAPTSARIARVFPVGNKKAVLDAAEKHDFQQRRALYLIDGDFEWVRGDPSPAVRGVYRLNAYCIENLLLHEKPAVEIFIEEAGVNETAARFKLAFDTWIRQTSDALVPLFISFAALNMVMPDEPTVGLGIGAVLKTRKRGKNPQIDAAKLASVQLEIDRKLAKLVGEARADEIRTTLRERVGKMSEPERIVSGKDFLMPLFEFRLAACEVRCRRSALRIRMARHSDPTRFVELSRAIDWAATRGPNRTA